METIPFTFNGSSKMPYFKSATVTGGFVKWDTYSRFILSSKIYSAL
jgi:hypothetical protein